jgi:polysaccharide transporter, PST family
MAMVVSGFLQVFKEAGLSTASIQRENITQAQISNLFWLNVALGVGATLVMAGSAPLIAQFFHQPALVGIALVLSITFVIESLAVQHLALLARQMRFAALSTLDLGCVTFGFVVGIVAAASGWGYWSLVATTLSTVLLKLVAAWWLCGWRPDRPRMHSGTRPLVRFGADLTLVGIVYSVSRACDSLLIGRYIGSDAVGIYSRGTVLLTRPLDRLLWPIHSVIVPSLSRLQFEPEPYRRMFLQVFESLAIGGFFLAGLLLPLASPLVMLVLGEQWDAAVPVVAALTFVCISRPLAGAASWLYSTQGRGRDLLVTASVEAALLVAAFIVGLQFGITGVAVAYALSGLVVSVPLTFYIAGRTGPVTTWDLWKATSSHAHVFAGVLLATLLARWWLSPGAPAVIQLLLSGAIGTATGLAALFSVRRSREMVLALVGKVSEAWTRAKAPEAEVET